MSRMSIVPDMSQASESLVAPVYHSERVKCLEIFYGEGFLSSEGEAKCKVLYNLAAAKNY